MKILIPLCFLIIASVGCIKTTKDERYSIKGKILKDCSGAPLALYDLRLHYKAGLFNNSQSKDWRTTTDLQGNFTFANIPGNYRENLYLYHDIDSENLVRWYDGFGTPYGSIDGQTIDLGTFYESAEKTAIFKFNINTNSFGSSDTLYIGQPQSEQKIYPIPSTLSLTFTSSISVPGVVNSSTDLSYPVYWGKNGKDFDSSWKRGTHLLKGVCSICGVPDTSFFTIP